MSTVKHFYMILYNFLQTLGWTYFVYKSAKHFHFNINNDSLELWHSVELPLKIFQTVALLEVGFFQKYFFCQLLNLYTKNCIFNTCKIIDSFQIIHVILGMVKSNIPITAFQVVARLLNLWGILNLSPPTQKSVL